MESYPITQDECTSVELIEFVKKYMNPPYENANLDEYLEGILKLFINFVRHNDINE